MTAEGADGRCGWIERAARLGGEVFALGLALLPAATLAAEQTPPPATMVGPLVVVAPAAGAGAGVDPDSLPGSSESLNAADLRRQGSLSITDVLEQRTPGLSLSDSQGNGFARGVNYRGFAASPLQGQPQGLAVYLGGVRLNEAFGDTVNWDLIPEAAVDRIDLVTGVPAFGLNALGGAISLRMKTGASAPGGSAAVEGGSFGRAFGAAEWGAAQGPWSAYLALDGGHEDGWRRQSPSGLARAYVDLGWSAGPGEAHLVANLGQATLGVVGPTPVDMLAADRTSVFTFPQITRNRAGLVALNGALKASAAWTLSASVYGRAFHQDHVDGNIGDLEGCGSSAADPQFGTLCVQDAFPAAIRPPAAAFQVLGDTNQPIDCPTLAASQTQSCNSIPYGTVDRTHTRSMTGGAAFQAVRGVALFGHRNLFITGLAIDHSDIRFGANSTLGLIWPDLSVRTDPGEATGAGQIIHAAGAIAYSPVDLRATTQNLGVYATDTLDLAPRLFLTLSGRWNGRRITISDQTGVSPDLNGKHRFDRFDPAAGLAWKAASWLTAYGGYAESSRAPTALELSCSNPLKPCLLESALVSDPPLKPVVAKTWQAGLRGTAKLADSHLDWRLGVYRSDNDHDIVSVASAIQGRGAYANVPRTRRQGFEAEINIKSRRWMAYASASQVQATYRFSGALPSPNSPFADDNGNVAVTSGDAIGGIAPWRLKAGGDYDLTGAILVGADLVGVSRQRLVGDESNQDAQLPGYWVASLHGAWRLGHGLEAYGRVDNLLDHRYATFGTYFDTGALANLHPSPLPENAAPVSETPAPPRSVLIGVRYRW